MISSSHFGKCFKLLMLFRWRCSTLLAAFSIIISCATSGKAEVRSETQSIRTLDRSIIVNFSYESTLSFLLAEDVILEILDNANEAAHENGNTVLRREVSSVSSASLVFESASANQSCLTALATISSGSYQLEFGVLIDSENLHDDRPIFIFDHLFSCSEVFATDGVLRYNLNPINLRIENIPPRFLDVSLATGNATISGLETQ